MSARITPGVVRILTVGLPILMVISALVMVVLIGHAGAVAVWTE